MLKVILLGNQGHIFHFDREPVTMTSLCITREGDQKVPFLLDTMEFSALLNLRVSLSLSLFFLPVLPVSVLKIIVPSM